MKQFCILCAVALGMVSCKDDGMLENRSFEQFRYLWMIQARTGDINLDFYSPKDSTIAIPGIRYGGVVAPYTGEIFAKIEVDASLVSAYNAANKTSCLPMPDGCFALDKDTLSIEPGKWASKPFQLFIRNTGMLEDGKKYLIPIAVQSIGAPEELPLNENYKTLYVIVNTAFSGIPDYLCFEKIYPVGNATPIGWHIEHSAAVDWDTHNEGKYIWDSYLRAGEFKIHTSLETTWSSPAFRPLTANAAITGNGVQYSDDKGENDLKWLVQESEAGHYRITLDVGAMTIRFEKTDSPENYYPLTLLPTNGNPGHQTTFLNETAKITVLGDNPYVTFSPLARVFPEGTTKAVIKFDYKSNKTAANAELYLYVADENFTASQTHDTGPVINIPAASDWTSFEYDVSEAVTGKGFGGRDTDFIQFAPIDGPDSPGYEIIIRNLRIEIE
jgi:hypothetical protein